MSTCAAAGKVRYPDHLAAKLALARTGKHRHTRRPKDETRTYWCRHCRGWHLTSQPKRRKAA